MFHSDFPLMCVVSDRSTQHIRRVFSSVFVITLTLLFTATAPKYFSVWCRHFSFKRRENIQSLSDCFEVSWRSFNNIYINILNCVLSVKRWNIVFYRFARVYSCFTMLSKCPQTVAVNSTKYDFFSSYVTFCLIKLF